MSGPTLEQLIDAVEGPRHLRIRPDCGACGYAINVGEHLINLVKDAKSSSPRLCKAFRFPDYGFDTPKNWDTNEGALCRFAGCKKCAAGPDTATFHVDCFNLYSSRMAADDKTNRLFNIATWMYPWKNVPSMKLEPSASLESGRGVGLAAELCGLPGLLDLPLELADIVSDYARPSPLWRFAAVLDLVASLSEESAETMESVPLSSISSWQRGGAPALSLDNSANPVIRLTIDSRGLRQIMRFPEMPNPTQARTDTYAFVVEHELVFKGVTADFKRGFGHLNMPTAAPQLKLWDRPCPPPLEESLIYHTPVARQSMSLRTIDLDTCSGLTFFMTSRDTYAIHAHTRAQPTARETFNRLSPRHQDVAAWVYVPFSALDHVEGFGVRRSVTDGGHLLNNPAYLFRTALTGDFSVGSDEKRTSRSIFTETGPGTKLVHNLAEGNPLSIIGAHPQNRLQPVGVDASQLPPIATRRVGRGCFSTATLRGAARLSVFEDPTTRACKGVVIEYANGGQRAIGQCRLGDHPVVEYDSPETVYLAPVGDRRQSMKWGLGEARVVAVGQSGPTPEATAALASTTSWQSYGLGGEMQFWFDRNVSQLLIV